jgi:uncharacterized membrane protein YbhN (UPF0104 family)
MSRRWVVWTLRLVTLIVVGLFAGGTARKAWHELGQFEWQVQPGWLLVSGALYALGLVPMAWFWQRTLTALRQPTPFVPMLRAYFIGHLAKYIPGKAMTVILRVAAVRRWVPSMRLALVSCLMETLTMMAVGAFLAAVLTFVVLRSQYWLIAIAAAMAAGAGLPTLPPIARWLARIGAARVTQPDGEISNMPAPVDIDSTLRGLDYKLLAQGWGAAFLCWLLLGWSLWATLRGIGVEQISPFDELPRLVASIAFAVVAGFAAMLPGGLGVRDAVLMQLLAPLCGDANALVAAILVRLVWLVSEVVTCGILYIGVGKQPAS